MSEYDKVIEEVRSMITTASKRIPELYQMLISENLSPQDARDRIEKDLADIVSKRTIQRYLPDEAKEVEKTRKNLPTTKKQEQLIAVVTNENNQELEPLTSYEPNAKVYIPSPTNNNIFDKDNAVIDIGPQETTITIDLNNVVLWRKLFNIKNVGNPRAYLKCRGNEVYEVLSPKDVKVKP